MAERMRFPVLHAQHRIMTIAEFNDFIERADANKDGQITTEEIGRALKEMRISWFPKFMAKRAVKKADLDRNGFVNGEMEIRELAKFAAKHWNIHVTD